MVRAGCGRGRGSMIRGHDSVSVREIETIIRDRARNGERQFYVLRRGDTRYVFTRGASATARISDNRRIVVPYRDRRFFVPSPALGSLITFVVLRLMYDSIRLRNAGSIATYETTKY